MIICTYALNQIFINLDNVTITRGEWGGDSGERGLWELL